jgi:hypothetical protein
MSQSSKKYIDRSHETYKWMFKKIEHYTWINWSVYYGTCFIQRIISNKEMWLQDQFWY